MVRLDLGTRNEIVIQWIILKLGPHKDVAGGRRRPVGRNNLRGENVLYSCQTPPLIIFPHLLRLLTRSLSAPHPAPWKWRCLGPLLAAFVDFLCSGGKYSEFNTDNRRCIWISFPRTGICPDLCHLNKTIENCCDQEKSWFFQLFLRDVIA